MAIEGRPQIRVVKSQLVKGILHVASSQLRLGHLAVKLSLLVESIGRCFGHVFIIAVPPFTGIMFGLGQMAIKCGLLIRVVKGQLVHGSLHKYRQRRTG